VIVPTRRTVVIAALFTLVALLEGRDYVIPDDVKGLAPAALRHRVAVAPELELEGVSADAALKAILDRIEVPEL
jgi:MoxR-like ATPase